MAAKAPKSTAEAEWAAKSPDERIKICLDTIRHYPDDFADKKKVEAYIASISEY